MKDIFIKAIHEKRKLKVTFFSNEDNRSLTRSCAPLDFAPSRRAVEKNYRYHFWDYDSDKVQHTLSLNPDQLIKIDLLDETFDPAEFVIWDVKKSKWSIERDWGKFS